MSENLLRLIPEKPTYTPKVETVPAAKEFLKSLIAESCEVQSEILDEIKFVDAGANFENVFCPVCGKEIADKWWSVEMAKAHKAQFKNLEIEVPCCKSETTLHHLKYNFPQGFARFVLSVRNPNIAKLDESSIGKLEQILGCELRLIWAHY